MKTPKGALSPRQEDLMSFLWEKNEPMTAAEMAEALKDHWNHVTLFKCVQTLADEGTLKVVGIERTGKTYSRKLAPAMSKAHYFGKQLASHGLNENDLPEIIAAMIGVQEADENTKKEAVSAAIREAMCML